VGEFLRIEVLDLLGDIVERYPEQQPEEAGDAGGNERRLPPPGERQPWDDRGGDDGADIRTERKMLVAALVPFRNRAPRPSWPSCLLTQPQRNARQETADIAHKGMPDREKPTPQSDPVADLCAKAIDKPSEEEQADSCP
jgi:hypothetical protein